MTQNVSRRAWMAGMAGAAAVESLRAADQERERRLVICAFSKHFQWTDIKEAADLCASFGYEGLDITLRNGGHVLPERVEDDLPKAVEIVRKAGLKVPMVTTDIVATRPPYAENVIK